MTRKQKLIFLVLFAVVTIAGYLIMKQVTPFLNHVIWGPYYCI